MDKELLEISPDRNKKGGTRNAYMLAKIYLRTGKQELFMLHLEIQTITSPKFPSRVFKYWYRLTANGNYTQQGITRFILFLKNMIHIEDEELNSKFDQQVRTLTGEKITMGIIETEKMLNIEEGIEIGQLAKQEKVVTNLILQLGLSDAQAAKVADAPISFVKKIRTQIEKSNRSKN